MNGSRNVPRGGMGIGPGTVSLLMIFVVLALTTFSTLAYLTARADDRLTRLAAESLQAYYAADAQGEVFFVRMDEVRPQGPDALAQLAHSLGASWQEEGTIAYHLPVGDRGTLEILLRYSTPQSPLARECWALVPNPIQEEETPAGLMTHLPIFKR